MNYWIFQAVPKRYNIPEKMKILPSERWYITRYGDEIKSGDVVYFWQAGAAAGLYGWGRVISQAPELDLEGDFRMDVSYQQAFGGPVIKSEAREQAPFSKQMLLQNAILKDLQVIAAPQGTNFKVKPKEARALNELIRAAGFPAPPDPVIAPKGGAA